MSTITVYLNEERSHSVSAGPKDLVRLIPGRNTVDADVWKRIEAAAGEEEKKTKREASLYFMKRKQLIQVMGEGEFNITELSLPDAMDAIEKETTVAGLRELLDQEQAKKSRARKTVVDVISNRIDELTMEPESSDDED